VSLPASSLDFSALCLGGFGGRLCHFSRQLTIRDRLLIKIILDLTFQNPINSIVHQFIKFHKNSPTTLRVIQIPDKQTHWSEHHSAESWWKQPTAHCTGHQSGHGALKRSHVARTKGLTQIAQTTLDAVDQPSFRLAHFVLRYVTLRCFYSSISHSKLSCSSRYFRLRTLPVLNDLRFSAVRWRHGVWRHSTYPASRDQEEEQDVVNAASFVWRYEYPDETIREVLMSGRQKTDGYNSSEIVCHCSLVPRSDSVTSRRPNSFR